MRWILPMTICLTMASLGLQAAPQKGADKCCP